VQVNVPDMPDVQATINALDPNAAAVLQDKSKSAFAEIVQEFGIAGNGPGQLDDARYVAVDADGNLWTADYQDGRVQQFDPSGKFLQLIQVPPDKNDNLYIEGLVADLKGNLYVTRGGDILKYSVADGSLAATFAGKFPSTRYQALAVDAQNNLYAVHSTASDNAVIKLNPDGKQLARWDDIVTKVNKKDAAMNLGITVDGLGNMYLASSFGNQVYSYDSQGEFIDRFGQKGNEPGQFNGPDGLAVDGHNHLYVHYSGGIDQFDTGGRFIGSLPIDYSKGSPRTVAVDREGFVYTVTSNGKVLKYQIIEQ
jgi:sugar lactone lactonase YvrE